MILTFDIEDFWHIIGFEPDSTRYSSRVDFMFSSLFEVLREYELKASFFFLGEVVEKCPTLVAKCIDAGFDVGSHSYRHIPPSKRDIKDFALDLERSLYNLEDLSGRSVQMYRAPGFGLTNDLLDEFFEILIGLGITVDSSVVSGRSQYGHLDNRFSDFGPWRVFCDKGHLIELPLTKGRLKYPLGGGYFRLFPAFLHVIAFKGLADGMSYFHLRDFDYSQPILDTVRSNPIRRFKSYFGIDKDFKKFLALAKLMDFTSISDYLATKEPEDFKAVRFGR